MNEEEVKYKRILPFIKDKLGYSEDNTKLEFKIRIGSNTTVFADIVVYLDDSNLAFVLDAKKSGTYLPSYKEQVISYGLLLRSSLSVLSDGYDLIIYDTASKQELFNGKMADSQEYLSKKELSKKSLQIITLNDDETNKATEVLRNFKQQANFISMLEKCEDIIRDNDGKTGEVAFGELSKMLFIKIFSERENSEHIFSKPGGVGARTIFSEAKNHYPYLFDPNEVISLSDETINNLINELATHSFTDTEIDIKGKAFETFIGNTLTGKLGQFFTPRTVVDFMVEFMPPQYKKANDQITRIIDPSCGSGGFLIEILKKVFQDIKKKEKFDDVAKLQKRVVEEQINGVDISPNLVRTAKMNMVLHGDGQGGILRANGLMLTHESPDKYINKFDYIYTNPPFGTKEKDKTILSKYPSFTSNVGIDKDVLFIEQYTDLLQPGGRLAVVLPNGILNNTTTTRIREYITEKYVINAVVGLPDRSFKSSGANSHTSVLFLKKKKSPNEAQTPIFMAVAKEVGFERITKRANPINRNDLKNILKDRKEYLMGNGQETNDILKLSESSFVLPFSKIENRLDANYYYAKYMVDVNTAKSRLLSSVCTISAEKITDEIKLFRYVQFSDISEQLGGIISYTKEGQKDDLPDRAKMLIRKNQVICARVFDSEKNVAIVPSSFDGEVASNGFIVLDAKIPYQLLWYFMRLPSTLQQVRYMCSGTILPSCNDDEFMQIRVPVLTKDQENLIIERVSRLESARKGLEDDLQSILSLNA